MRMLSIVSIILALVSPLPAASIQNPVNRESLRGIRNLRVFVADIDAEIEQAGLTKSQLQIDVELMLRKAGIPVITSSEGNDPYLYVDLNVHNAKDTLYFYSLNVSLEQMVKPKRNPSLELYAPTWQSSETGAGGRNKPNSIRDSVDDQVDKFINDYLTVNPK